MRCWAGCPGEVPRGLIWSAQQKLLFKQDQVSCYIVTKIPQKSCFLSLMLPCTGLDAFGGQITKNCSYTEVTNWSAHASLWWCMMLFLIFYSHSVFLHLGHILLCPSQSSSSVPHSVVTFTYLYRKCYKAQPKNPQSVTAYSSIWKQELISLIFYSFSKKTPQICLCAASQCPSEDSDAPACAGELFWGLPAQFC